MTLEQLGAEGNAAIQVVADAISLVQGIPLESAGVLTKANESPVTVADFAVQALVAARLARQYPRDPLVAEEDATTLRAPEAGDVLARVVDIVGRMEDGATPVRVLDWIDRGGGTPAHRFWTLDPIDGTRGFLRGGQYVVALALIVDGQVQLGVIGCPRLDLNSKRCGVQGGIAVALRGREAWWTSLSRRALVRLSVSTVSEPARARVLHSVEARHSDVAQLNRLMLAFGSTSPPILMDSQAKHVTLAAGNADLLIRLPSNPAYQEAIWDEAAGSLIVEEAGGMVTDLAGRPLDFSAGRRLARNHGLLASNGRLHDAVRVMLVGCQGATPPSGGHSPRI